MRPRQLKTKIFLDSGDEEETKEALELLGFLDGQTTNPTLIAKHPSARLRIEQGKLFDPREIWKFYKERVRRIAKLLPRGSVSVEVYADRTTTTHEMFEEGKKVFGWIRNAHIKYPITKAGLVAAQRSIQAGRRVNMTLCFTQEQAAAVHAATRNAKPGSVFVSPFVGRLDDIGLDGMSLLDNILRMLHNKQSHVETLAASIRSLEHFLFALYLESDIVTAPLSVLRAWKESGMEVPHNEFFYDTKDLSHIAFRKLQLGRGLKAFNIAHHLTDKGIDRFASDWNALIRK